ncbi:hypothetical protein oki169_16730 [Helicobacter pylori]
MENIKVYKEYSIENGRLDLYIHDNNSYLVIENKICAQEHNNQLIKYAEFLAKQPGSGKSSYISNVTQSKNSKFTIITNRKNIFKKDKIIIFYKNISYSKHMLIWINECQKKLKNILNLYQALEFYKDIVEIISNQKDNKMGILNFLKEEDKKGENHIDLILEIIKEKDEIFIKTYR